MSSKILKNLLNVWLLFYFYFFGEGSYTRVVPKKKKKKLYLVPKEAIEEYLLLATQCADFLAKLGTGLENDFVTFSSPPVDLLNFFRGWCLWFICKQALS